MSRIGRSSRARARRAIALLIAVAASASPMLARAEVPGPDERRARDGFYQWTILDDVDGHNHVSTFLYGPASYPDRPDGDHSGSVTRVEVTTSTLRPDGSIEERRFEAPVSSGGPFPGTGGFTEGPCFPCGPYGTLFFALPHDFGDATAIIDVRLSLSAADGDCEDAPPYGPCGGSVAGYVNPGFVGIPNPWDTDAGDALAYPILLH